MFRQPMMMALLLAFLLAEQAKIIYAHLKGGSFLAFLVVPFAHGDFARYPDQLTLGKILRHRLATLAEH